MPETARRHFDEDIDRAQDILVHAQTQCRRLQDDLRRAAWMFAVAALDAYLCDAYVDLLCRQLKAFNTGKLKSLPSDYRNVRLPAGEVLKAKHYPSRGNWALRMAARTLMEEENMLKIGRIVQMFNPALPPGHKIPHGLINQYISTNIQGLLGTTRARYRREMDSASTEEDRNRLRKSVWTNIVCTLGKLIQRRHDIVHNCDRPKQVCTDVTWAAADKAVKYVRVFVEVLDEHLDQYRMH